MVEKKIVNQQPVKRACRTCRNGVKFNQKVQPSGLYAMGSSFKNTIRKLSQE